MKTVVIVDDSSYMRSLIKIALNKVEYQIVGEAENGVKAIDMIIELEPDLITMDNILPDMTGLDVISAVKDASIESKIVVVSAVGQDSIIKEANALGIEGYLVKPFQSEELIEMVGKCFETSSV